jgi:hypothetical protein
MHANQRRLHEFVHNSDRHDAAGAESCLESLQTNCSVDFIPGLSHRKSANAGKKAGNGPSQC